MAGVPVRPPLAFGTALALGSYLDWRWPAPLLPDWLQWALGLPLCAAGIALIALTVRELRRAGTPLDPRKPAVRLVITGPFALTRNPAYLSLAVSYLGIAVAADNLWTACLLPPLLVAIDRGVIRREERYLDRRFGAPYRAYRARVRRWL